METTHPEEGQLKIERYKAEQAVILELTRATIQFEHAALKPLPLLNGGAIVATLTFVGHMLASGVRAVDLAYITGALAAWILGLVAWVIANFMRYFSQYAFLKA